MNRFSHVMLGGLTHEPVQRLSQKLEEFLPGVIGGQSCGIDSPQSGVRHQKTAQAAGANHIGQPKFFAVEAQGAENAAGTRGQFRDSGADTSGTV